MEVEGSSGVFLRPLKLGRFDLVLKQWGKGILGFVFFPFI